MLVIKVIVILGSHEHHRGCVPGKCTPLSQPSKDKYLKQPVYSNKQISYSILI